MEHIQPGKPQQNAYVERYNRTVRYDWLAQYLFESIEEVQEYATRWLWTYKIERPNMALGEITPRQKLDLAASTLLLTPAKNGRITMGQATSSILTTYWLKRGMLFIKSISR